MSDLIRREEVLKKLSYEIKHGAVFDKCGLDTAYNIIKNIQSAESERKWIPVTEALPEEGKSVIVCSRYGAICIVGLVKGISEETRKKMKNGEIDDPCEKLWCLSDGYKMSKRSDLYREGDEFGNNQKDYAWKNGPYHYSGQEFIAWMPLPEPWRGE